MSTITELECDTAEIAVCQVDRSGDVPTWAFEHVASLPLPVSCLGGGTVPGWVERAAQWCITESGASFQGYQYAQDPSGNILRIDHANLVETQPGGFVPVRVTLCGQRTYFWVLIR